MRKILISACCVLLLGCAQSWAEVPRLISYQGVLTNNFGNPVDNGTYDMTFAIFASSEGGTALWSENRPVTTWNGVFEVNLGDGLALNLPFDREYWLETASFAGTFLPRTRLVASPYSLRASDVDDSVAVRSLNGLQDDIILDGGAGLRWEAVGDTLRLSAEHLLIAPDISGETLELTASWQSYGGCTATMDCPGAGVIVCESSVTLQVSHDAGTADRIQLCHSDTQNSAGPNVAYYTVHSVPAEFPEYFNNETTHFVKTVFVVTEAGERSYYLNARSTQGVGGDRVWYGNITATFYPGHMVVQVPVANGALQDIEKPSR